MTHFECLKKIVRFLADGDGITVGYAVQLSLLRVDAFVVGFLVFIQTCIATK